MTKGGLSAGHRRGRQAEDGVATEAEARDSGLEDEEGEGSWKPAARAAPSTLASVDRTRVGKLLVSLAGVCALLVEYLTRTASE
jgi:hypothetical protein